MKNLLPLWGFLGAFCVVAVIFILLRLAQRKANANRLKPVEEIVASLRHPKPMQRIRAAEALGERTGTDARAAVDALLAKLEDPEAEVRAVVVSSLGKLQDHRAHEPLRPHLQDPSTEVRGLTVSALVDLKDFAALPEIMALLDDDDWTIRAWTMSEMVRLGKETALDRLLAIREKEVWRAHLRLCDTGNRVIDERAVSPLLVEMRNTKDFGIRVESMLTLCSFGYVAEEESRTVECLLATAEEENPALRFQAVCALGDIELTTSDNFDQAKRGLQQVSKTDENHLIRAAAAHVLKSFTIERERAVRKNPQTPHTPDPSGKSPIRVDMLDFKTLTEGLNDRTHRLRWRYAHMLAQMKNPKAVEPLCLAARDESDWRLRAASVRALGKIGHPDARGTLERLAIEDRHTSVREAAEKALEFLNQTARN
jgi:HEAT repeat protein